MDPIGIIILAAGASTRMGQSKQLISVDHTPLLRLSTQVAIDAGLGNVVVVLGANANQHREIISDLPVGITINAVWQKGMGSSLKVGLGYLLAQGNCKAMIIMVCDQPAVTSNHLQALHREHLHHSNTIISSRYENVNGVPALFPSVFFEDLKKVSDEGGARQLISKKNVTVRSIDLPHGEIDLDEPGDIERWKKRLSQ